MKFRVLGPLEVCDDGGTALPLGQGRERALLALLLLHANEVVSVDRIVDDLWGESAPPTAEKIVRNQVSHLRRLIDDSLVTDGHGYRLAVSAGSVDAERFESLVAEGRRELEAGRADTAAERLDRALSLWRGPPLEEFAYEHFALGDIARLEELRAAAIEDHVEARLALGLHTEVVPELEQLVGRYPLRERLRRQLMLALYRSGRQAEALEQYRQARAALVEELGLEPTDDLRELERAILAHDPALDAPATPHAQAAAEEAPVAARRRRLHDHVPPRALAALGLVLVAAAVVAAGLRLLGGGSVTVVGNSVAVLDPAGGRVVADVPVGSRPAAVAVGAGGVWVANAGSGTVSRIDPRTRKVVATIGVRVPASDIAVGEGSVWVVGGSEGTLVRIDPRSNTPVGTTNLAGSNAIAPNGAYSVAAGAGAVWVGSGSGNILRIDPETGHKVDSIPVGQLPVALAVAGGDVWAALYDGRIVRIDARADKVTGTTRGPSAPLSLAAGAGAVWVGDEPGLVWRIDPATALVAAPPTFSVPPSPLGLAVDGRDVWVVSPQARAATRIDARSGRVLATVPVHGAPLDVAAGAGALWVTIGRPPAREHP